MMARCFRHIGLTKRSFEVLNVSIDIPVWEKSNLSLEEASAYFNIGINKLRQITDAKECEKCVLWVGNRRLIKRVLFEEYLREEYSV